MQLSSDIIFAVSASKQRKYQEDFCFLKLFPLFPVFQLISRKISCFMSKSESRSMGSGEMSKKKLDMFNLHLLFLFTLNSLHFGDMSLLSTRNKTTKSRFQPKISTNFNGIKLIVPPNTNL